MPCIPWRMHGVILFLVLACVMTSCSGDEEDTSLSGTYVGTIQDSVVGAGTVRITLSQTGSTLSGTWQMTFANPNFTNSGSLSGTVSGQSITLTLTPSNPTTCPFNVTATMMGANRFVGTYAAFNCGDTVAGSLDVTRQ